MFTKCFYTSTLFISIACEFPDVFPKELPRIPMNREIKFYVKVAPITHPISKAPYYMVPTELKKL